MNIKHYISAATLALVALGFSACDGKDEPDYKGAANPTAAQRVYFANKTESKIVTADATETSIAVYRPEAVASGELTVQLTVTDESGLFQIPEQVTFADNMTIAEIPVKYDVTLMTPNQEYPVSIAIDDDYANEYGIASVNVIINYELMTEWALFTGTDAAQDGYGVWRIGTPWAPQDLSPARLFERHIPNDEKRKEFILQVYNGEETDETKIEHNDNINDEEWLEVMRFNTSDNCKTINMPVQPCPLDPTISYADAHTLMPDRFENASSFDSFTGVFTINVMPFDDEGAWNPGDWFILLDGYADTKDYSISLHDAGQVQIGGVDYSVIGFEMTENVAFVNYTLVKGELTEEDVEQVAQVMNAVKYPSADDDEDAPVAQADEETPEFEINTIEGGSQNVTFSFPSSATYTIVAIGYKAAADEDSYPEMKSTASLTFDFKAADPFAGWTLVTEDATWTDNILPYLFGEDFEPVEIKVRIDKSDDFEGLYRISNPYANYPDEELVAACVADFGCIEYDLSDPDNVIFPLSETGFVDGGDELAIVSFAAWNIDGGVDPAEIPAMFFGKATSAGDVTLAATNQEQMPSFLAYFGGEGPYLCDVDFSLKGAAQAAPAGVAPRKVAHVGKKALPAAKRVICPARYHVKSAKAVKASKAAAGKKALDRTAAKTGLRRR